ncbi:helix-turn-helix domain-containing protein [Actinosynnema sp. CA-248983]
MSEAPLHDDDFWLQPELQRAFQDRHFGRVLRSYRRAHTPEIKQVDLARWIDRTQGQLSRIERSTQAPTDIAKLSAWAVALRIPERYLWFKITPAGGLSALKRDVVAAEEVQEQEGLDVRRRDLLKVAGVAAAAASAELISNSPWQRLADSVERERPVDGATLRLMQDRTADLFQTEETVPARKLLDSLSEHEATLSALLKNARTDSDRRSLGVALGETKALAGWVLFDTGQGRDAANAWRETLKLAKHFGDGALAACALGYWSYLAAARNDTGPAVKLLQQAEELVPGSSSPATRSWIAARHAEELARLGDDTGALRAIERAMTAFDFAQPRTERPWTSFFSASRLGSLTVSTYTILRHVDAGAIADSLLASLSPRDNKVRALILADLATAAASNKDFDQAGELAEQSGRLAVKTEASLAKTRLITLASTLPTDTNGAENALRQQIASAIH